MKVKLSYIIDAIEMMDQYSEYFLDKETGKVEWVSYTGQRSFSQI